MNTKVNIAGVELKNPVTTASGTYGFGLEYQRFYDIAQLGAVTVKGLTLEERGGNAPPRIAETSRGVLNSIGLQNPGVDFFVKNTLPLLRKHDVRVIANIAGNTKEDYCEMAVRLSKSSVDLIEMNVSCPNVKEGGIAFGVNPKTLFDIVSAVRKVCPKPLIVKLSPNVTDITETARAARDAGADALSLINTLLGMKIDIRTKKPVLANTMGGLSGPAVMPVAVRMVYQVRKAVELPLIGMGGISTGADAVEFIMAGASAVSVGTANLVDPFAALKVKQGIENYMEQNGVADISELTGIID